MNAYMGVSLPIDLLSKVDEKVKIHFFSSRADFVKNAIRRELERLNKVERSAL